MTVAPSWNALADRERSRRQARRRSYLIVICSCESRREASREVANIYRDVAARTSARRAGPPIRRPRACGKRVYAAGRAVLCAHARSKVQCGMCAPRATDGMVRVVAARTTVRRVTASACCGVRLPLRERLRRLSHPPSLRPCGTRIWRRRCRGGRWMSRCPGRCRPSSAAPPAPATSRGRWRR